MQDWPYCSMYVWLTHMNQICVNMPCLINETNETRLLHNCYWGVSCNNCSQLVVDGEPHGEGEVVHQSSFLASPPRDVEYARPFSIGDGWTWHEEVQIWLRWELKKKPIIELWQWPVLVVEGVAKCAESRDDFVNHEIAVYCHDDPQFLSESLLLHNHL